MDFIDILGLTTTKKIGINKASKKGQASQFDKNNISPPDASMEKEFHKYTVKMVPKPQYNIEPSLKEALTINEYTIYCKRWHKDDGITCGAKTQTSADYIPDGYCPVQSIPSGYKCEEFTLKPEIGGQDEASLEDLAEVARQMLKRNRTRSAK